MSSLAAAVFARQVVNTQVTGNFSGRAWGRATTHLGAGAPIMRA